MACADPGIFVRGGGGGGGPGQSDKKSSDNVFFFCFFFFFFFLLFLALRLFLQKSNGQFQRNLSFFQGSRGVPTFSRGGGGVQLFPGGSNCLFPIETHITCYFPGGSGPPVPPPWIRTCVGLPFSKPITLSLSQKAHNLKTTFYQRR